MRDLETTTSEPVKTVFRTFTNGGDVIALFPQIPHDILGRYVMSYQSIGQHGGADYKAMIRCTRPATTSEIRHLSSELARIGYTVQRVERYRPAH